MWHHGRTEDAGAEQDALGAAEAGREQAGRDRPDRWPGEDDFECERGDDDAHQHRDHRLETAEAAGLQ